MPDIEISSGMDPTPLLVASNSWLQFWELPALGYLGAGCQWLPSKGG